MTQMYPGWHFCAIKNGKPILRDGSQLVIGRTVEITGELKMCQHGCHDSERLLDALNYAPGPYLCRVLVSADMADRDKRCSRFRVAVAGMDATLLLHEFSARIAYCALLAERDRGREPDQRLWDSVSAKMRWCRGEASDADLSAAESAAWGVARGGTLDFPRDVARCAAWCAAQGEAQSAARGAVRSVAESVALSAADDLLVSMLPAELTAAVPIRRAR